MIPDEAVEAAARALQARFVGVVDDQGFTEWEHDARAALEAAAPHLLSHEREQTRLAHLDAMVNRETKREELESAWDEGELAGFHNAGAEQWGYDQKFNPYRKAAHGDD